jgi:hypothetical protein
MSSTRLLNKGHGGEVHLRREFANDLQDLEKSAMYSNAASDMRE